MTSYQRMVALGTGFGIGLVLLVLLPIVMPDSSYLLPTYWKIIVPVTLLASGFVFVVTESTSLNSSTFVALGVMIASAIRLTIDIHHDRTSHNLFPFEVVFEFIALLIAGWIGAFFARLATRETAPRRR